VKLPAALLDEWRDEPAWIADLPRLAAACAEAWSLVLEEPLDTPNSLVVPAGDAVLKLNAPSHFEAEHEADALALWAGPGAARLLARDDARRALLVERCSPGTRLWDAGADEIAVVADLLPRLRLEPETGHPFRLLADEADRWVEDVPRRHELAGRPFERSLVHAAVDVFRTVDRAATSLANQDLHGGNVLAAEREPWLVIDPKPLVGEPELDGVGLLRNAAFGGGTPLVRRWLDALGELGLDRARLQGWGVAHALAWGWDEEDGWSARSVDAARAIDAS
jgi:streptomycin 6-kinase